MAGAPRFEPALVASTQVEPRADPGHLLPLLTFLEVDAPIQDYSQRIRLAARSESPGRQYVLVDLRHRHRAVEVDDNLSQRAGRLARRRRSSVLAAHRRLKQAGLEPIIEARLVEEAAKIGTGHSPDREGGPMDVRQGHARDLRGSRPPIHRP